MSGKKFILVGCDDTTSLYVVLQSINETNSLPYHIVSSTRANDIAGMVESLNPELVILSFRNMTTMIKDINKVKADIPMLCLMGRFNDLLQWDANSIVFTCQFEHIRKKDHLSLWLNSILSFEKAILKRKSQNAATLAQAAAMKYDDPDNNRSLSRFALELDQKVEMLSKIKVRIAELYPLVNDKVRTELVSIVNWIKMSANDNKLWADFKLYFERSDPDFLIQLAQKYPDLTPIDLKYCCYLKMNMSNDDIRNLLGINQESVRTHKYRLKKKMSLAPDQDLRSYLFTVGKKSLVQ